MLAKGKTQHSTLYTPRIKLRQWQEEDLLAFSQMNCDPRVMEFMPKKLTRALSDELAKKIQDHFTKYGYGLWACELLEDLYTKEAKVCRGSFIGFVGLHTPSFQAHFTPCIEIGWRLIYDVWGQGLATEAARAVLHLAREIGIHELVSFTSRLNLRSQRVMEKLNMQHNREDDFMHPLLDSQDPLAPHVLYRITLG